MSVGSLSALRGMVRCIPFTSREIDLRSGRRHAYRSEEIRHNRFSTLVEEPGYLQKLVPACEGFLRHDRYERIDSPATVSSLPSGEDHWANARLPMAVP